jgi:hypothetical protein
MTTTDSLRAQHLADQFGRKVAVRLAAGTDELSYEVRERLRAARVRAIEARRQPEEAPVVVGRGLGSLALRHGGVFHRIASVLPLLVLAAGLILIHSVQKDHRASELAELDAALLTDDLPPAAYADPGFVQFLKSGRGE